MLIVNKERQGLIRSRIRGSVIAKGETLMFLDSHCEMALEWLQPLMQAIKKDRKLIVAPIIDTINPHTFEVESSKIHVGSFDWNFRFKWIAAEEEVLVKQLREYGQNVDTPVIAGGLFAVGKCDLTFNSQVTILATVAR